MLIDDVAARLAAQVPELAGAIEGATDFASQQAQQTLPDRSPFAYVLPLGRDAGSRIDATGMHIQRISERIGVLFLVRSSGDATGSASLGDVSRLRDQITAAIAAWIPADAIDAFELVSDRLAGFSEGTVFYQIDFTLQSQLRI